MFITTIKLNSIFYYLYCKLFQGPDGDAIDDPSIEGVPLMMDEEEDYEDGVPMDGAALLKGVMKHSARSESPNIYDAGRDVDGVPSKHHNLLFHNFLITNSI